MKVPISYFYLGAVLLIRTNLTCFSDEVKTVDIKEGSAPVLWDQLLGVCSGSVSLTNRTVVVGTDSLDPHLYSDEQRNHNSALNYYCSVLSSFAKDNGPPLWQMETAATPAGVGEAHNPIRGVALDGSRAYFTTSSGELYCVEIDDAFVPSGEKEADKPKVVWRIAFAQKFKVNPRNANDLGNPLCTPVVLDDLVFSMTNNGVAPETHAVSVSAPSFVAVNKATGEIAWTSSRPNQDLIYGQWASPVEMVIQGEKQIVFPGGDGTLYGFEPATGTELWHFDCNEASGLKNDSRLFFVASPIVSGSAIFVGLNGDYETDAISPLCAITVHKDGKKFVPLLRWAFNSPDFLSTYLSVAIAGNHVFAVGRKGILFDLSKASGKELWHQKISLEDDGTGKHFGNPIIYHDHLRSLRADDGTIGILFPDYSSKVFDEDPFSGAITNHTCVRCLWMYVHKYG